MITEGWGTLHEPEIVGEGQESAWSGPVLLTGNMTTEELLRFVMGSFVISVDFITVTFMILTSLQNPEDCHECVFL